MAHLTKWLGRSDVKDALLGPITKKVDNVCHTYDRTHTTSTQQLN